MCAQSTQNGKLLKKYNIVSLYTVNYTVLSPFSIIQSCNLCIFNTILYFYLHYHQSIHSQPSTSLYSLPSTYHYHNFLPKPHLSLPGGNLLLSMSMATMLMIMTQIGLSRSSGSFLTKAMTHTHCVSSLDRSGYCRRISRFTFCWNLLMSNSCVVINEE